MKISLHHTWEDAPPPHHPKDNTLGRTFVHRCRVPPKVTWFSTVFVRNNIIKLSLRESLSRSPFYLRLTDRQYTSKSVTTLNFMNIIVPMFVYGKIKTSLKVLQANFLLVSFTFYFNRQHGGGLLLVMIVKRYKERYKKSRKCANKNVSSLKRLVNKVKRRTIKKS